MTITLPKTNLPFCRNVCAVYDKQDMQLGVHCSCLMTIQPSLSGENLVNDGGPLALFFLVWSCGYDFGTLAIVMTGGLLAVQALILNRHGSESR